MIFQDEIAQRIDAIGRVIEILGKSGLSQTGPDSIKKMVVLIEELVRGKEQKE